MSQDNEPMMVVPANPASMVSIMKNGRHITGTLRPQFSFQYEAIQFSASVRKYMHQGAAIDMTPQQQQEVLSYLATVEVDEEKSRQFAQNVHNYEYLKATDWYVTRFMETGVPIPEDISAARAAARAGIIR